MIAELGHFALFLAGAVALVQFLCPLVNSRHPALQQLSVATAVILCALLNLSFAGLAYAFLSNDFTIGYVSAHSNSLLPWYYRISALWGGHEGSLLLWIYILSLWNAAVALRSRHLPGAFRAKVLGVLGYISCGFIAFILLTSDPFRRIIPAPFDGQDLNPLLQDPGLILHPPLLYTGYVGFAVAFAFVIAGLWQGQLDTLWLRRVRPWTLAAWLALTLGITLGSYWAYYELGWGGWWFWDPVENASLMPWLIGTALVHSLIVSEKRGLFMTWTALLAITAFSLSLVGTFLVRSGVLTSVHAFAADPTRGIFILALLSAITLPALLLLIWRAAQLNQSGDYARLSRETGLLLNNWLFTGAWLVVFTGTLYPLVADVLHLGKISVGAPYFNRLIVPLALLSLLLLWIGPLLRWRRDRPARLLPLLGATLLLSLIMTALISRHISPLYPKTVLTLWLALQAALSILADYAVRIRHQGIRGLKSRLAHAGMSLAHLGYIISVFGITAAGLYSSEQDLSIRVGSSVRVADYRITLAGLENETGANYQAVKGIFVIEKAGMHILTPAKRTYFSSPMPITESARLITPYHDLYLAMGEPINADTWAVRVQYKPFIIWIWLGALVMAAGACLAGFDRSYRTLKEENR